MKRSKVRTPREDSAPSGQSPYGKKRASGNMMYGPGCCAHKVSPEQIAKAKQAARERGHFAPAYSWLNHQEFTAQDAGGVA